MNVIKCTLVAKIGTPHFARAFTEAMKMFSNASAVGTIDRNSHVIYDLSGNGRSEFAVTGYGNVGLVTSDWVYNSRYPRENVYWVYPYSSYDETYYYYIIYFLAEGTTLRGIFNPQKGHSVIFYFKDGTMYSELQCNDSSRTSIISQYMPTPSRYNNGGYWPIFTGNQIFKSYPFGKYCEGERQIFDIQGQNLSIPSGMMMKFQGTFQVPIEPEYINMIGKNVDYNYTLNPTASIVTVGGKDYIHIGGSKWMKMDSYAEQTINEPE